MPRPTGGRAAAERPTRAPARRAAPYRPLPDQLDLRRRSRSALDRRCAVDGSARLPPLALAAGLRRNPHDDFCGPIRYNRRMFESPPVVIVTGSGGSGCGRAIAARWAAEGAAVVVSDIHEAGGQETLRLIEKGGGRATF